MPDFQIKISTPVELEGAKALADQLEKDIGRAKALGEATEELEAKLKRVQGAVENAAPAAHKLEIEHRELKESVRATGRAFGGLGEVGMLLSPVTAVVYGLVAAVEALKEHFTLLTEAALESAKATEEIRQGNLVALAGSAAAAAAAMNDYERQCEAAAEAEEHTNQAAQDRIALFDAETDGIKKVNEAEERLAEAEIDRDVATGKITEDEGTRRKHVEQERLGAVNAEADAQKEHKKIEEDEKTVAEARARLAGEKQARAVAMAATEKPTADKKNLDDEIARQEEVLKKQQAQLARDSSRAKLINSPNLTWEAISSEVMPGGREGQFKKATQDAAGDAKIVEATAAYVESLKKLAAGDDEAAKAAKNKADELQKQILADQREDQTGDARIEQEKKSPNFTRTQPTPCHRPKE
jgi:hypothetical protein